MKTKIKIGDLESKLTFATFRKEFLRIVKEMKNEVIGGGNSPEDAIPIFIKAQHSFADNTAHPLVILAGQGAAWKKAAKDAFKENKKEMLEGRCYLNDGKLFIILDKGNLKLTELKKALKALLKKADIKEVVFTDGKVTAPVEEEVEKTSTSTVKSPKQQKQEEQARVAIDKMTEQLTGLMSRLGLNFPN